MSTKASDIFANLQYLKDSIQEMKNTLTNLHKQVE
jgi:hypothetical protein